MTPDFVTVDLPDGPAVGIVTHRTDKDGAQLVDVYAFPSRATGQHGQHFQDIPIDPDDDYSDGPYCARTGAVDLGDDDQDDDTRPAAKAPVADWRAWAVDVHDLDPDEAAGLSKADIQARYPE